MWQHIRYSKCHSPSLVPRDKLFFFMTLVSMVAISEVMLGRLVSSCLKGIKWCSSQVLLLPYISLLCIIKSLTKVNKQLSPIKLQCLPSSLLFLSDIMANTLFYEVESWASPAFQFQLGALWMSIASPFLYQPYSEPTIASYISLILSVAQFRHHTKPCANQSWEHTPSFGLPDVQQTNHSLE